MFNFNLTFLLTLFFTVLAAAEEEIMTQAHGNAWKYGTSGGVIGFIVLVLDLIVFMEIIKSSRTVPAKLLWCLVVFIFPILGLVIYWLFSDRAGHAGGSGYESIA